jgi:hypothetical protein
MGEEISEWSPVTKSGGQPCYKVFLRGISIVAARKGFFEMSRTEIAYLAPSLGLDPSGLLAHARSSIFAILQKLSLRSQ